MSPSLVAERLARYRSNERQSISRSTHERSTDERQGASRRWTCPKLNHPQPAASALPLRKALPARKCASRGTGCSLLIRWAMCFVLVALFQNMAIACQELPPEDHDWSPLQIDPEKAKANGLRVVRGKHITLYTDLPASETVDPLTKIFDAAVPQWGKYFQVPDRKITDWKVNVSLMRDRDRFEKAGIIPKWVPEFPAGLNRAREIWFFTQQEQYYTQHLMLHEGTHAFMQEFCDGYGAPWYAEGMAELLGLHQWDGENLKLPFRPTSKRDTAGWGRPFLIRKWIQGQRQGLPDRSLQTVILTPDRAFRNVENYAWGWAACEFLSLHPKTREKFPLLTKSASKPSTEFNAKFLRLFGKSMDDLEKDWALFIGDLDYGLDPNVTSLSELKLTPEGTGRLAVDRSWQFLSRPVKKGDKISIQASGRFIIGSSQIGDRSKPWPCEASGISIEYFRGRKLGELQAMVLTDTPPKSLLSELCDLTPMPVGNSKVITISTDGTLCLRINESPSAMSDNTGFLKIAIEKVR